MNIIIQSLGFNAGNSLETFVREKVNALKSNTIVQANVTLFKGPSGNIDSDYCEIRLEVPGNDHFVKKHSAHFETSVTECVEILAQQIQKAKSKHASELKGNEDIIQDELLKGEENENDIELEDIIR